MLQFFIIQGIAVCKNQRKNACKVYTTVYVRRERITEWIAKLKIENQIHVQIYLFHGPNRRTLLNRIVLCTKQLFNLLTIGRKLIGWTIGESGAFVKWIETFMLCYSKFTWSMITTIFQIELIWFGCWMLVIELFWILVLFVLIF